MVKLNKTNKTEKGWTNLAKKSSWNEKVLKKSGIQLFISKLLAAKSIIIFQQSNLSVTDD